jgi:hypothetical protein
VPADRVAACRENFPIDAPMQQFVAIPDRGAKFVIAKYWHVP